MPSLSVAFAATARTSPTVSCSLPVGLVNVTVGGTGLPVGVTLIFTVLLVVAPWLSVAIAVTEVAPSVAVQSTWYGACWSIAIRCVPTKNST
ncbi:Uncharacterised protein [Vibrio cholerae]|nr:Uncharacterised protein [Vibrio cholerae]CSB55136.1 Uncharacterised protein [Vibrio cholerae]CSC30781.1 Uncharacterised protein [Vibrio cholerae]CSC36486.1 Uncharacterised protein [Vibrio cholerae]CSC79999.1 Uncharacterised protein [Vibrio cholerae]